MHDHHTTTRLSVTLGDEDTALARLLGVVRRRGFRVRAIEANFNGAGAIAVLMAVESQRPVDVLIRQIARIIGVEHVSIEPPLQAIAVA
ncbi:MAG: ACT domain-containing protein [Phycisphaerales bacterium]